MVGCVNAVINLWAPWNGGNFLTRWETVSFSGRTQDVTHWTHVLDSVTLKDPPPPTPNQNKLPTLCRYVDPDCGTQWLAWRVSERHYIASLFVCLSACNVALITGNPSKIITTWGSLSHTWQYNVVLHRYSRYTGLIKCITFLVQFLAFQLLIGRKHYFVEPLSSPRGLRFENHWWNWKQRSKTLDGMPRGSASGPDRILRAYCQSWSMAECSLCKDQCCSRKTWLILFYELPHFWIPTAYC
jgi:hypothetical protein